MTKICKKCGHKNSDEVKFCTNCGVPFEENESFLPDANFLLEIPEKYNSYNISDTSCCFNCKQDTFTHLKKSGLLSDKSIYFCKNCGLTLEKMGNSFKLVDILDKNNPMWWRYNKQKLNIEEWELIANGSLSNKDKKKREDKIEELRNEQIQLQKEQDIEKITLNLSKGEIFWNVVDSPADLNDNEEAFISISNIKLCEPKITKNTSPKTLFKLTRGVTLKSNVKKATSAFYNKLNEIDIGTLVITNERVIFIGDENRINIGLREIISINIFNDGISIQRENNSNADYFTGTNQHTLNFEMYGRKQTLVLDGNILRAILLGQIANCKRC